MKRKEPLFEKCTEVAASSNVSVGLRFGWERVGLSLFFFFLSFWGFVLLMVSCTSVNQASLCCTAALLSHLCPQQPG